MTSGVVRTIFDILPLIFSAPTEEKQGRSVGGDPVCNVVATDVLGANYGQQTAASDSHDKKNFGLSFSSDRGISNQYSNTGTQAAATGGLAQGQGIGYASSSSSSTSSTCSSYQYQYPSYYPSEYPYPIYPNYGVPNVGLGGQNVDLGTPNVGVGAGVQLPNVSAGSVAGVQGGGRH